MPVNSERYISLQTMLFPYLASVRRLFSLAEFIFSGERQGSPALAMCLSPRILMLLLPLHNKSAVRDHDNRKLGKTGYIPRDDDWQLLKRNFCCDVGWT
jgi:hypothetical protein